MFRRLLMPSRMAPSFVSSLFSDVKLLNEAALVSMASPPSLEMKNKKKELAKRKHRKRRGSRTSGQW